MPEQPGRDASENLVHWRPQNQGPKTQSTGEALHGETGFAQVFRPQNEGYKFRRKRNSSLDTSMAKPTPKHLLRMVEREVHLECLGASVERPFEEAPGLQC